MKESAIKADLLCNISQRPEYMIWNHPTGTFRTLTPPYAHIRCGLPGSADVIGCVSIVIQSHHVGHTLGIALGIETKTLSGSQAEQQKLFQAAWERRGAIYLLRRQAEGTHEAIQERLLGSAK